MKRLSIVLLLSLSPLAASASGLECRDTNEGPDSGYSAEISADSSSSSAAISEETIAGPRKVATLSCKRLRGNNSVDGVNPIAECTQSGNDSGYRLSVLSYGAHGPISASLSDESLSGKREVARLSCR